MTPRRAIPAMVASPRARLAVLLLLRQLHTVRCVAPAPRLALAAPCSHASCPLGAAADTPCTLPPSAGLECVGDSCTLTCAQWREFLNATAVSCPCGSFSGGKCMARGCQPCAAHCLPWYLREMEGPLGTGLLCCADSANECDPCCSHAHAPGHCCTLECPCTDNGSDCPSSAGVCLWAALFEVQLEPALWIPLALLGSLPVFVLLARLACPRAYVRCTRTSLAPPLPRTSRWRGGSAASCLTCGAVPALRDLSPAGAVSLLVYAAANVLAFVCTKHGWG